MNKVLEFAKVFDEIMTEAEPLTVEDAIYDRISWSGVTADGDPTTDD